MPTDEELDREWKPSSNRRPQSTMAKSFSLTLDSLFDIDNSLADLNAAVSEKKRVVDHQTHELEALEARLRATEERLKQAAGAGITPGSQPRSGRSSPHQRTPLGDTFAVKEDQVKSPLSTEVKSSRPNTGRIQTKEERPASGWKGEAPMPGALPPSPVASEGESDSDYIVVQRADNGEDGNRP